jgi:hypothetical protein
MVGVALLSLALLGLALLYLACIPASHLVSFNATCHPTLSEYSPPHRCSAIGELQRHPLPRSLALSCDFETSLALTLGPR